ncbi:MAG: DUF4384 domain-containing protein [Candidatus Neomarinimicrobiota bacterium]
MFKNVLTTGVFLFFLTPNPGFGQSSTIKVAVDTAMVFDSHISVAEAKNKTLAFARECAIKMAVPEEVMTSSVLTDLRAETGRQAQEQTAINIFAISTQVGFIVDEKIITAAPAFENEMLKYHVKLQATVEPTRGERNPSLSLDLSVNRNVLKSGEPLIITAKSTENGYLYLFDFLADNSVLMMFPNPISPDNSIRADIPLQIPTANEQKKGISYKVQADPNKNVTAEAIFGVFCKNRIAEIDKFQTVRKDFTVFTAGQESFTNFQKWLVRVPLSQRVEKVVPIQIFK